MDGLQWKTLLQWMIWGYHFFGNIHLQQLYLPLRHGTIVIVGSRRAIGTSKANSSHEDDALDVGVML